MNISLKIKSRLRKVASAIGLSGKRLILGRLWVISSISHVTLTSWLFLEQGILVYSFTCSRNWIENLRYRDTWICVYISKSNRHITIGFMFMVIGLISFGRIECQARWVKVSCFYAKINIHRSKDTWNRRWKVSIHRWVRQGWESLWWRGCEVGRRGAISQNLRWNLPWWSTAWRW